MCDIGLWVWFSGDRDSICCEFRAHEVHWRPSSSWGG